MRNMRYLEHVATLILDKEACIGCSLCTVVCPHQVFQIRDGKAVIVDLDSCMECGACVNNCPVYALKVTPGVG
ncbi:MAG: 4Fe-4S binding protein [Desulfamplus sp.]|nr:4Fe-4S binding protein [Desulfamplus sp.]